MLHGTLEVSWGREGYALSLRYAARRVIGLRASSAHSFDPIVMKLGMDTSWDPESVMG